MASEGDGYSNILYNCQTESTSTNKIPQEEEDSIDKAFNDIACQEVTFANQGYSDGLISGSIKHCQEGYKLGLQKGFEIGSEVGNYRGFAIVSLKQISTQGPITKLSSKQQRCIKVLEKLLKSTEEFPSTNPSISDKIDLEENPVDVWDLLRDMRAKYIFAKKLLNNAETVNTTAVDSLTIDNKDNLSPKTLNW